jgi:hypothetical protein
MTHAATKLGGMRFSEAWLALCLGLITACSGSGDTSGAGGGGEQSKRHALDLGCTLDSLMLRFPIVLSYELDEPLTEGAASDLRFTGAVTIDGPTAEALIDAMVPRIDIISVQIEASVAGASPSTLGTFLGTAPINDFNLEIDTDDDGEPGPHRLELETVTVATTPRPGAERVEIGLDLDGVSFVFGDFEVPEDCVNPSLVGSVVTFEVQR